MSEYKRGISALSLKEKIGAVYQTAWAMCQKIRHATGERDEVYTLISIIELDEAFFGASAEGGKRGRGTDKTAVFVSVSPAIKPEFEKMKGVDSDNDESADGKTVRACLKSI